ncbi:sigma 54-interacting transcriptional regulator [Desulfovirgula thermocuniculi]|uniref:sigma 54-interacting transcriptional regulator n=1 Tax=Desulfovirgula thermocuniculi TaxID=348842 RepID=UPI00040F4218|nr:sigma 54-interacting transcriptional regulator [Desulfovirgula thermocuniculi]
MPKIGVAIAGGNELALSVYRLLKAVEDVEILGLADPDPESIALREAAADGTFTTTDCNVLPSLPGLSVLVVATGEPAVKACLHRAKPPGVAVIEAQALDLVLALLKEREKLLEARRIQGELEAILNSVQEAIEVADSRGVIKYVNPAFTRITGISERERIGRNIFEASPDGALAMVLRTGRSVSGYRTTVGGSNAEVISNAAPIIVDGKMEGAVVVFQHFTDVMKLMEQLRQSTRLIESLSDKFGQVTTSKYTFADILGNSYELRRCVQIAERAAQTNSTVLLLGESGTGKELFAHAIHSASSRRDKPFIKVNCAAIPENLLESEFFGYEKGAFTGAVRSKIGKFELAHGGTIFLDEIGDMNLNLQGKLLRVLQEMEFERVGGNQTIKVDVRVIAATNRNLRDLIRQGKFREDLYYRLNVVEITIPPLRVRKEDLPVLVSNLIVKLNRKLGKKVKGISKEAEEVLYSYDWPGNVRELENVFERVMVTADEEILDRRHFAPHISQVRADLGHDLELMPIDQMEQILIKKALEKFGTSVEGKRRAAQALNISLATLYNKLKKCRFEDLGNYKC